LEEEVEIEMFTTLGHEICHKSRCRCHCYSLFTSFISLLIRWC